MKQQQNLHNTMNLHILKIIIKTLLKAILKRHQSPLTMKWVKPMSYLVGVKWIMSFWIIETIYSLMVGSMIYIILGILAIIIRWLFGSEESSNLLPLMMTPVLITYENLGSTVSSLVNNDWITIRWILDQDMDIPSTISLQSLLIGLCGLIHYNSMMLINYIIPDWDLTDGLNKIQEHFQTYGLNENPVLYFVIFPILELMFLPYYLVKNWDNPFHC